MFTIRLSNKDQAKPFMPTRIKNVLGCTKYKGPRKTLKGMESAIAKGAEKKELIRVFFAFDIDEALRKQLSKVIKDLKEQQHGDKVKWISVENLHVTLRFLGEISPSKIEEVVTAVGEIIHDYPLFELEVGKIMSFPPSHPHILALSFPLAKELAQLVQLIEQAVNQCGFTAEDRPYLPHLTLGRLRSKHFPDIKKISQVNFPKIKIAEIVLYRSDQGEKGSVYTPLVKFKLK